MSDKYLKIVTIALALCVNVYSAQTNPILAHEFLNDDKRALKSILKRELKNESDAVKNGLWLKYRVAHSKPGDVIELEPGRYTLKVPSIHNVDRFFHYEGDIIDLRINHDLTIRGTSENPNDVIIDWEGSPLAEKVSKGLFVTRDAKHQKTFSETISLSVENITFENTVGWGHNGAGVRVQGSDLTVKNCRFINNQNGILFTSASQELPASETHFAGTLLVEDSYFERNGDNVRQNAHGIYMSQGSTLTVRNSEFVNTKNTGHHIKTLAKETIVTGSTFSNRDMEITYNIDTPNGGSVLIENNIFEYYASADGDDNRSMFLYGTVQSQQTKSPAQLDHYKFRKNTIRNYHPNGQFLVPLDDVEAHLDACGNKIVNADGAKLRLNGLDVTQECAE